MKRCALKDQLGGIRKLLFSLTLCLTAAARAQFGPGFALQIDGSANYVAVPHLAAFNSFPLTVIAWVNTTRNTGQQGLVNKYAANSLNGWNLFLRDGHLRAWYFVDDTRHVWDGGNGLDGGFIADGKWHHVALVVDSTGARLYVDAAHRASRGWTGSPGAPTTTQEMRLGNYPGGVLDFTGSILLDDISVWRVALNGSQVKRHQERIAVTGREGDRLANYLCDEGSGLTVADTALLEGANHGAWVGAPRFVATQPAMSQVAWYRLGENDPGAGSGGAVNRTTTDVIGDHPLNSFGAPVYSGSVSTNAAGRLGSSLAAQFSGNLQYLSNAVGFTARDNFGLEAWVNAAGPAAAHQVIAYNGDTGLNGWGIVQSGDQYLALLGGVAFFGSGEAIPGAWTHLALVRDNGLSTFYVNGLPRGSTPDAPNAAAGGFALGARPTSPGEFFAGSVDEARVFTFPAGQFRSGDLLLNVHRVATLAATEVGLTNATLHGRVHPLGLPTSAWFEWGVTTNYGHATRPLALGGAYATTNLSQTLSPLFSGSTIHYRAVLSNALEVVPGNSQTLVTPVVEFTKRVIPGSVSVTIQPPEALVEGARWILDDGPAVPSGPAPRVVTPGIHRVRFQDLPNWREPPPFEVIVIGGRTSEVAVVFAPLPVFDFQAIPEQHVRQGESVEFFVRAGTSNAAFQITATPLPAGPIAFDPSTGHFAYKTAPADRLPFTLDFSFEGQSATTLITPLPELGAEEKTIQYDRALPDEESRDYMTITETPNAAEVFNDVTNQTVSVDISGKTLVFDVAHPANLHRQYHGRENIKDLRLYADRVIIRSPLWLPQTRVSIRARELRFEGEGVINTIPKPRRLIPAGAVWEDELVAGRSGETGHPGGDVDVLVERFHADPAPAIRFMLQGGDGGPAGEGRDGVFEGNGLFSQSLDDPNWTRLMARSGNVICGVGNAGAMLFQQTISSGNVLSTCGDNQAPARGEPAVPSGVPGTGGRGGTLLSTLDLSAYAQMNGGAPGARGGDHVGGTLFFRYVYSTTTIRIVRGRPVTTIENLNAPKVPGANASAPSGAAGAAGRVVLANPESWLHSFAVRSVVRFAKDAYLNGRTIEARAILAEYRDAIGVLQKPAGTAADLSEAEFAESTSLDQAALEIDTLLHRLDSNLDFFGNPAGWAPQLSFEASLIAFEREVDQSIPILYLAYFLNRTATNLQNTLDASSLAVSKLKDEMEALVIAYNTAQTNIPRLKVESESIRARIAGLQARLSLLEQELAARAQQNVEDRHKVPFWKKALGVIAVAADLVPVGQPIVGKIGSRLGLLARIDPENPIASAKTNAPKLFEKFTEKNIEICFTPPSTNATNAALIRKERLKALSQCGKFLGAEIKELAGIFKEVQIDKKEVAAELEKLKAADPVFQEVIATLAQLNVDKERFAQELAAALQAVATLTGAMTENALATDQLEDRIARSLTTLDHNALLHVREMERRAKERLLKFQYFVAQAFQYRVLRPYSGNLQLNRLFERFQALIEAGNGHVLTATDFETLKSLYLAELRDTVAQTLQILNANAPERSLPVRFQLLEEELQRLNTEGQLLLNLRQRGIFPSSHENIRIIDLRARALAAHPVGGAIGSFALLFLDFEHLGTSRLDFGGQTFLFRHYPTEAASPIAWNTVYDGLANSFTNSLLSPSAQSLLSVLLNQPTTDNLLLFSRPAADGDILIRKEVQTASGIDLALDRLEIELEYEFSTARSAQPQLEILVSDDLEPVITLSPFDLHGRGDGQGDFRRVFPSGTGVTLQAPSRYGELLFERWVVNNQLQPAGATALSLVMTAPMTAQARFSPAAATNTARLSLLPAASGTVGFQFATMPGHNYIIERKFRLDDPVWEPVETRPGTGTLEQFTRPTAAGTAFFRLRVE